MTVALGMFKSLKPLKPSAPLPSYTRGAVHEVIDVSASKDRGKRIFLSLPSGILEALERWAESEGNRPTSLANWIVETAVLAMWAHKFGKVATLIQYPGGDSYRIPAKMAEAEIMLDAEKIWIA